MEAKPLVQLGGAGVVLALVAFNATAAWGGETLRLAPSQGEYSLAPYVEVFVGDPQLSIHEISRPELSNQFRPVDRGTPHFGMTRSAVWVRFTLAAEDAADAAEDAADAAEDAADAAAADARAPTQWFLDMGWSYLSDVTLFTPSGGGSDSKESAWVERHGGRRTAGRGADLQNLLGTFLLPQDIRSPQTFYLRVQSETVIILPLKIYSQAAYSFRLVYRILWYGLYFGTLVAVVLYNLLIFGSFKERIYIYFAAVLVSVVLYLGACNDLTPLLLKTTTLSGEVRHVLLTCIMLSFGVFVREFLKFERLLSWADRLVVGFLLLACLGLALTPVATVQFLTRYDSVLGLAAPFAFVPATLYQWRRGFSPARFLLLAMLGIVALGFVDVLVLQGVLPYTEWIFKALEIGAIVVAIQFSRAVGSRIQLLRQEHEEALRKSEETFRALSENSMDIIARSDRDGRVLYVNPAVERELGQSAGTYIGKALAESGFPQEVTTSLNRAVESVFSTKQPTRVETEYPAGRWRDWELVPEFGKSGEVVAVLASGRDITERKRGEAQQRLLETQLAQAQKLESVGRLAAGVAHDFNNLLMPILGYADLILSDTPGLDSAVRQQVENIQESAERARHLTRQLLAFGRKQTLQMQSLDLNELVLNFMKMLKRLIGEDVEIQTQLSADLSRVTADETQVEQVLLNLAVNSRDAMPGGGRLTLETAPIVLDDAYAADHPEVQPGNYVMLSVSDTGCGMTPEVQKAVFEPFFTTKGPGEGTGLGLSTVYGIVKQHRGHISLYSEPGRGTTFRIYFPGSEEAAPHLVSLEQTAEPVGGAETILLVEDDDAVRKLTFTTLKKLGYNVMAAQSGAEALKVARETAAVDLLLTDVIMPELSGRQVYEQVAAIHSGVKALYMSGYPSDIIAHHGILDEGISLLQKPFTRQGLAQKVREVLEGKRNS